MLTGRSTRGHSLVAKNLLPGTVETQGTQVCPLCLGWFVFTVTVQGRDLDLCLSVSRYFLLSSCHLASFIHFPAV